MRRQHSLNSDIKWGLRWGLWFAVGYSLLASVLYVFQGTLLGERSRFYYPLVIASYFLMGIIGGLLTGLLRPITHSRLGATAVGIVIGLAVYFIAGITTIGAGEFLSLPGVVSTVVLGTAIGGACGYNSWLPEGRK